MPSSHKGKAVPGDFYSRELVECDSCGVVTARWDWEYESKERCPKHDRPLGTKFRVPGCYVCHADACKACECRGTQECPRCPDPYGSPPVLCSPTCTGMCLLCVPHAVALRAEMFAQEKRCAPVFTAMFARVLAEDLTNRRASDVPFVRNETAELVRELISNSTGLTREELLQRATDLIMKGPPQLIPDTPTPGTVQGPSVSVDSLFNEHSWEVYGPGHECSYVDCYCDHITCLNCGVEEESADAKKPCRGEQQ